VGKGTEIDLGRVAAGSGKVSIGLGSVCVEGKGAIVCWRGRRELRG
jgi:hypothetical protein